MINKLKPYFVLSKRDQRGSLLLILILICSIYLPKLFDQAVASSHVKIPQKSFSEKLQKPVVLHEQHLFVKPNNSKTKYRNYVDYHRNASTMNFNDWDSLAIFERKEIGKLLQWRREKGGHITWKELVEKFDLSKEQAVLLKKKVNIED
jgi:hypothetical protein